MMIRKKRCVFCSKKDPTINYNDPNLRHFIGDKGKIIPARYTGACARHQRQIKRAIKLARNAGFLSFISR